MIRIHLFLCFALFVPGCSHLAIERRFDNPAIRRLQEESVRHIPERPINGQTLKGFFKNKVGLIETTNNRFPTGRAAPITRDGYYLTASHVVDEGEFHLSQFVKLKPLPRDPMVMTAEQAKSYFRWDRHKGRVVWKDEAADLAIVKFDHRPSEHFKKLTHRSEEGAAVFSAAINGRSLTTNSMDDRIGNGSFETAGEITDITHFETGVSPYVVYESTLVARGGMSGTLVVDRKGRLAGIIHTIQPKLFAKPTTLFSMLDPKFLHEIVATDRSRN